MRVITAEEYLKKKKKGENIFDDDLAPVRSNNGVIDIRDLVTLSGGDIKDLDTTVNSIDDLYQQQKNQRKWFDTGAFDDGFDLMDIPQTISGTISDVRQDLTKGLHKMTEGIVDAGAYLVGGGAKLLGQDEFADKTKKFIAKDIVGGLGTSELVTNLSVTGVMNNLLNGNLGVYKPSNIIEQGKNMLDVFDPEAELQRGEISESNLIEGNSLLGDKTDSLVQSAGQLLGTIGLQSVGVPWFLTTGASSFGGETEQAFNEGASYLEAGGSGLVSAFAEIVTEKISGGINFGGKTLDDVIPIKKLITDKITNKTLQTLTKFGIDAVGEGAEEVLSEAISNAGRLTYQDKTFQEAVFSEEAFDQYLEAFIGGAVMGGGFNIGKAHQSIKTGRDYDTGLTTNEQKVLDKEIEDRIKEASKDNKKLSNKEINKIKDEAKLDLQKGNISTGTIESTLGGETYKSLQNQKSEVESIKKEIKKLKSKKMGEMSVGEYNESTAQIKALQERIDKIDTKALESQLNKEMEQLIGSDDYLQRSYYEKSQRGANFEADLSKYDAKQQEVIKKAIDSGILNNTTKTHEFVDMVAKLSADKGVSFDFTNNERLKGSSFAVKGKTVNGFVNENGDITLNVNSNKALNSVVGHEITHVLEGTELYTELQQAVKNYATTKGVYDTKLKELQGIYKNVKGANIEKELTADLVGDYLFTDTDFVRQLSVEKPNLFQKIYNEIKYLVKIATAGSKEARDLEKVKKAFEDAYRQSATQSATQTKQQSIKENKKLYDYTKENKMLVSATDNLAEILESGVFDAKRTSVGSYDKGTAISEYGKYKVHLKPEALDYVDKMYKGDGGTRSEFIKENKETFNSVEDLINNHPQTSTGQTTYDELTFKNDIPTDLIEMVEIPTGTDQSVIDMLDKKGIPYEFYTPKQKSNTDESNLLSMFGKKVQKEPTIEKPSEGLTKEQQEYFKDSKVRNEDGSLMVMYHGTSSGGHTAFDTYGSKYGLFGQGSYFTNDRSVAESYTEKGKGKNPQIYETYLNITNPIDMDSQANAEAWKKVLPDADFPASGTNEDFYRAMEEYYRDAEYSKWEASEEIIDVIRGMGYDGITHIGGGRFNKADDTRHRVYIAFDSNQIKNVDNTKPTASEDIRYSLSDEGTLQDSNGNEVTLEASDTGTHGTLMAIHNLNEGKLKGVIELGGFPVPSIAITKVSNAGSNQFGNITVLFDKETINPADRRNEVYDRDVWTPTFPRVEYDINTKTLNRIRNLVGGYGNFYLSDANSVLNNIEYKINGYGLKNAIDEIKKSDAFKYVYLKNKDSNFEPITKTTEDQLSSYYSNEILREFAQEYGEIPRWTEISDEQRQEIVDKFKEKWQPILEAKRDKMIAEEQAKAEPRQYMINMINSNVETNLSRLDSLGGQDNFIRDLNTIQENNAVTTKIDKEATKQYFDDNIDQAEYEKWVDEQFKDITSGKGIRNDKDIFTPSGNRRTFKQTHEPYDLANIVKYMTKQKTVAGEEGFGAGSGFGTIQAQMSTRFKSIDEIRQYADEKIVPSAEEHDLTKPYSEAIHEDMASLVEYYKFKNDTYSYPMDNAGYVLNDFAGYKKQDINGLKRALQENQFNVEDIPMSLLTKIVDDVNALRDMPTDYFEAKPQRAVGLDEVQAIVIPNTTDTEFKQQLQDAGLKYYEYDPNIEGDKQRVINQFDDLKFSLSNKNDIAPVRDSNLTYGEDVRIEAPINNEIAKLSKQVEDLSNKLNKVVFGEDVTAEEMNNLRESVSYDDIAPIRNNLTAEESLELDMLENLPFDLDADSQIRMEELQSKENPLDETPGVRAEVDRSIEVYKKIEQDENLKPFYQQEAEIMLAELQNTIKGERILTGDTSQFGSANEQQWIGIKRQTSSDIAELLDSYGYSYKQIEAGLKRIIEDKSYSKASKDILNVLESRLLDGYTTMEGYEIPANESYISYLTDSEMADYYSGIPTENASNTTVTEDIAPVGNEPMLPADNPQRGDGDIKQRKWVETSTESDVVNRQILPDDLDAKQIYYQVKTNAKTLEIANNKLGTLGYDDAVTYFNNQLMNKRASVEDIALGERLIQEAIKKGDKVTASELIQNVAILGTELGQKVQALSIIKRMTPEGQLRMLDKTIKRAKAKEDVVFKDIELTQEMKNKILEVYNEDGSYDQDELNRVIEEIKQEIADQMPTTAMEKVNAWRYLSMLGNPKTHIRNIVSNVAMKGTLAIKNAMARTIESVVPIKDRTKTWKKSSDVVTKFADDVTLEMKDIINGDSKYNEEADIKAKRDTFKNKVLNGVYNLNSNLLEAEDWWFSKSAFKNSFAEYLTANGIETELDIENNPEIVEKAKNYALEQSQIATFRQYSWLANKIRDIESKNVATQVAVGSIIPFKKTPINIAKAGLSYSPLGFAKTLTYDIAQVKKGKMEASTLIDHLAQNTTGTALTLIGYMLASAGFLNGGGEDDKEGKYDYQLGEQAYSITIGGQTYSLSWLSPVAMPLFVGANAYEQLVEGKELDGNVIVETLAQTLDPLSEMSFLSGLDQVLSSYDSGMEKFAGIFESMGQNYITQFIPTISSQVASTFDDTKRTTKVSGDSGFKFGEETYNKIAYKIPGLRNTLEPSTDVWGNEVKQNDNIVGRAFDNFLAPYSRRENITSDIDYELKDLYAETGENGLLPSVPYNYVNYKDEKYKMSAEEHTQFKKTYGQTAYDLLEDLFETATYQNADIEDRVDMVENVYDYARDTAKKEYLEGRDIEYTNATKDKQDYYKENSIKEAIKNDVSIDEMDYAIKNPSNYAVISQIDSYENYVEYKKAISDIKDMYKSVDGMTSKQKTALSKQRKRAVQNYIESLNLSVPQKIMLEKMAGGYSVSSYKNYMYQYIESLPLSAEEKRTIHNELFD